MKKLICLLSLSLVITTCFGQRIARTPSPTLFSDEHLKLPIRIAPTLKSEGEIFFKETFNWENATDPKGWRLPSGWQTLDVNEIGHNWVWRAGSDSIKGKLTRLPGHIYSQSPEDGYFVLPMDEYNFADGVMTMNEADVWFQLPVMNFSTRPGVFMKFSQDFRCCCNPSPDIKCLVSTDRGNRWSMINLMFKTGINAFCTEPYPMVNLSEMCSGMPEVWIRFVWKGSSHYFWCIDDLELSEAYQNEISLEEAWPEMSDLDLEDNNASYFFMVPFSQTGINHFGEYTFRGLVSNLGISDQENCLLNVDILRNGLSVYQQSSPAKDLWSFSRDTLQVSTPFIPDGYGDYKIILTAESSQTDGDSSNNQISDTFHITDSIYSLCDWECEEWCSTNTLGGNNDGDHLGVLYDISHACEASSISCMIMRRKDSQFSTEPGYGFIYSLFRWVEETGSWEEKISSDYVTVSEEMINTWVTVPLNKDGESEFLVPGAYIAAIQTYHGHGINADLEKYRFTIGGDMSHPLNANRAVAKLATGGEWFNYWNFPMVRLHIAEKGAPVMAEVVFNVDMRIPIANGYFRPENDYVAISGTFNNWEESAPMTDADSDGIYSITVPNQPVFQKIEYKYRINGSRILPELPSAPNRVYRTSFYNSLNDIFNNGLSMASDTDPLLAVIRAFPNPVENSFNLVITGQVAADLHISLTNIEGIIVYDKLVREVADYRETVDISKLASGIYLLKVNQQVMKLVVR